MLTNFHEFFQDFLMELMIEKLHEIRNENTTKSIMYRKLLTRWTQPLDCWKKNTKL